ALEGVGGHVDRLRLLDRGLEPHVHLRVAAEPRRGRDLANELREHLPPRLIRLRLLALDLGPLRMTGHRPSPLSPDPALTSQQCSAERRGVSRLLRSRSLTPASP